MNPADPLLDQLAEAIRRDHGGDAPQIIGIRTGGVWVAEALARRLGHDGPIGSLDIAFYRDDFSRIGLHPEVRPSHIPFPVEDRRILLVDDVLHTGRTVRAALNEIFDYGRPAAIDLAVLVDRGGRELPICARYCGERLALPEDEEVQVQGPDPITWQVVRREARA